MNLMATISLIIIFLQNHANNSFQKVPKTTSLRSASTKAQPSFPITPQRHANFAQSRPKLPLLPQTPPPQSSHSDGQTVPTDAHRSHLLSVPRRWDSLGFQRPAPQKIFPLCPRRALYLRLRLTLIQKPGPLPRIGLFQSEGKFDGPRDLIQASCLKHMSLFRPGLRVMVAEIRGLHQHDLPRASQQTIQETRGAHQHPQRGLHGHYRWDHLNRVIVLVYKRNSQEDRHKNQRRQFEVNSGLKIRTKTWINPPLFIKSRK